VSIVNARVHSADGASSIRFSSRVLGIGEPPHRGDVVVDARGGFVLPGLINAHDHLELNHYGRRKFRDRYRNVSEWVDDMRPRLEGDHEIASLRAHRLDDRLLIGGVKNLLSGVTTVAHHNPLYRELRRAGPIRVLRRFGWAHSFGMEHAPVGAHGERGGDVARRFRACPPSSPFIVHLGEGTDAAAAAEVARLDALSCLRPNTVLVHALALGEAGWRRVSERGASVVWCPASNLYLFGEAPPVARWLRERPDVTARVCLGTDSRLSGAGDLLEELRLAHSLGVGAACLLELVTRSAANVLRLPGAGRLEVGGAADLLLLPPLASAAGRALLTATRRDVSLVAIAGRPIVGAPDVAGAFDARCVRPAPMLVDGVPRLAAAPLVDRLRRSSLQEAGVAC
jgi:cytosine/adenosine deaminase-related metal-dependent hydrolase